MSDTPEERREAQKKALKLSDAALTSRSAGWALDALLAHFEESGQQALADAVKYGQRVALSAGCNCSEDVCECEFRPLAYAINYPEGEKR